MTSTDARLAVLIATSILLAGCLGPPEDPLPNGNDTVRILITQDMGTFIHLDENVTVRDATPVMDLLHAVAEVETAHDGEFVVSINGKKSGYPGNKTDWFYHINGRLAGSGAAHQSVAAGDVVIWDHRPWNHTMTLPWVLTGTESWPIPQSEILSPGPLNDKSDHPHLFIRINADRLIVLDSWSRPSLELEPPWLVAHVTEGAGNETALLVAASSEDAQAFIDSIDPLTPRGLGVVITPEGSHTIPAAT